MTAAIAGMMTSRISRRARFSLPERGFLLVSAAGGACSPGKRKTGSAIAALPGLAWFGSGLVGGANVLLDEFQLRQEPFGLHRLQMRKRRVVDLVAQHAQLHH